MNQNNFEQVLAAATADVRPGPDAGSVPVLREAPRKRGCGCKGKKKKSSGLVLAVGAAALLGFGLASLRR